MASEQTAIDPSLIDQTSALNAAMLLNQKLQTRLEDMALQMNEMRGLVRTVVGLTADNIKLKNELRKYELVSESMRRRNERLKQSVTILVEQLRLLVELLNED